MIIQFRKVHFVRIIYTARLRQQFRWSTILQVGALHLFGTIRGKTIDTLT